MEEKKKKSTRFTFKYTLVRKVKAPVRAHQTDAGIDFFIPTDLHTKDIKEGVSLVYNTPGKERFIKTISIGSGGRILIPSGVKVNIPNGTSLVACNKSGVSSRKGLIFSAQVIDSTYTGEIHIGIINTGKYPVYIEAGEKIIQFLHIPIIGSIPEEITKEEYEELAKGQERGEGGFGSSDKPEETVPNEGEK